MVFYQVFLLPLLQCTITDCRNYKRLREFLLSRLKSGPKRWPQRGNRYSTTKRIYWLTKRMKAVTEHKRARKVSSPLSSILSLWYSETKFIKYSLFFSNNMQQTQIKALVCVMFCIGICYKFGSGYFLCTEQKNEFLFYNVDCLKIVYDRTWIWKFP